MIIVPASEGSFRGTVLENNRRWVFILLGAMLLGSLVISARIISRLFVGAEPEVDLVGLYDVSGENPDGSVYSGSATITAAGNEYVIRCDIKAETIIGNGSWAGERLNVQFEGGQASYTRTPNGVLNGSWSLDVVPDQGSEILSPR